MATPTESLETMDAHQRAHAAEIERRFAGGRATTGQVILFGLTGGLLPCSAAVAVLLVCLQTESFALGIALVAAFSVGLAVTLVLIGVVAAWGTRQATRRFGNIDPWLRRLPYLSSALVAVIGVVMVVSGLNHWPH